MLRKLLGLFKRPQKAPLRLPPSRSAWDMELEHWYGYKPMLYENGWHRTHKSLGADVYETMGRDYIRGGYSALLTLKDIDGTALLLNTGVCETIEEVAWKTTNVYVPRMRKQMARRQLERRT